MKYDLSDNQISDMQKKLKDKNLLIIDESSFLGINTLCLLDYVLCKVKNTDLPFGGLQIIMLGDYQQLKCVGDFEIFKPQKSHKIEDLVKSTEDIENDEEGDMDYNDVEAEAEANYVSDKQIEDLENMDGVCMDKVIDKTLKKQKIEDIKEQTKINKKNLIAKQNQRFYSVL